MKKALAVLFVACAALYFGYGMVALSAEGAIVKRRAAIGEAVAKGDIDKARALAITESDLAFLGSEVTKNVLSRAEAAEPYRNQ